MKNNFKWIAVALALCMVCAIFAACDQTTPETPNRPSTPNNNNTNNSTTAEVTTQEATTEEPVVTEFGNYSSMATPLTLETIFEKDIKKSNEHFNIGSSYEQTKLDNVFKITDYIANYEKYVAEYEMEEQLEIIYAETGFTLDMGFAADMMKHYLDGEGASYDFSASMTDLLETSKINGAQATTISAAMKAAENLVNNGQSGVAISQTKTMQFGSLKPSDGPAYYALGDFKATADMTDVKRDGDTFSATITFRIVDFYDWKDGDNDPLFTEMLKKLDDSYRSLVNSLVDMETLEGFCQEDLAQLHHAGWAKNYLASGSITYNVTWTAGQTFDQATVVPAQ